MARLNYVAMIIGIALTYVVAEDLYNDKYDDIDFNKILLNDRLRNQYYNCILEKGPCVTADAKFLKEIMGEAIITKCKKCTEKQKNIINGIADWYEKNDPDKWQHIIMKLIENAKKKNAGQ